MIDPALYYAELRPGTNIVARFLLGADIKPHALTSGVQYIDITGQDVEIGYIYQDGAFHPVGVQGPVPDVPGFITALKAAMGGIVNSNLLARAYPTFYPALQQGVFDDAQALIIDAHTTGVLNDAQYAAFRVLAEQFNLPLVLP